jgi:hypothetical protein
MGVARHLGLWLDFDPQGALLQAGPPLIFNGQKEPSTAAQNTTNILKAVFGNSSPSRTRVLGLWDSRRIFEIADDEKCVHISKAVGICVVFTGAIALSQKGYHIYKSSLRF